MSLTSFVPGGLPAARVRREPVGNRDGAAEALVLANECGLSLMPWQADALTVMLTEAGDGRWAAPEFGVLCPRQNGKTHLLAARIIAGLFVFDEPLITYTAQSFKTALEVFRLVDQSVAVCADTARRVRTTRWSHGEEQIELHSGARFKIMARTRSSGRGFAGSTVILDEALELRDDAAIGALMPTLSAQDNPQLIYSSSAGDPGSVVLANARKRALDASDPGLGWIEYAADTDAEIGDPAVWAEANPAFGDLIRPETIERELLALTPERFRQERLGVWAMDATRGVIPVEPWVKARQPSGDVPAPGSLALAFDVSPGREFGAVVAAWQRGDGRTHVRVSRYAPGDGWLVDTIRDLCSVNGCPVAVDDAGPGRDIADALERAGVAVHRINRRDYVAASAALLSAVTNGLLTHQGDPALDAAAAAAGTQRVGEAWMWSRRGEVDVSALSAATLAYWSLHHAPEVAAPLPRPVIF